MAMNPIQFQSGMSLNQLFEHYGTEAQCEAVLEAARWPHGQVMCEREQRRTLHGAIAVDDAYLGGKHGGKRGRGSANKVPFVAAVEVDTAGHPQVLRLDPLPRFNHEAMRDWAERYLAPATQVLSDGLNCFTAVATVGMAYQREVVGTQRRSTDIPCFAWINILLGNLKTALAGTHHAFGFRKYTQRYLAEYQYRFNRRFDLQAMLPRLLRAAATTGPRTEIWLRLAEQ